MPTKQEMREFAQFERVMYRNFPTWNWEDGIELDKIARSLHHLAEVGCNYGLTKRQETREANLEKKALAIADKYGFEIDFNGDPRGFPIYIHLPDGSYNSWGGQETGYGIG